MLAPVDAHRHAAAPLLNRLRFAQAQSEDVFKARRYLPEAFAALTTMPVANPSRACDMNDIFTLTVIFQKIRVYTFSFENT